MNQPMYTQPKQPVIAPWLLIVFIIVLLGAGAYFGWYFWNQSQPATTEIPETTTTTTTSTTTDETAGWETYNNADYSFSFMHPNDLIFEDETSRLESGNKTNLLLSLSKKSSSNEPMADNTNDYYDIEFRLIDGNLSSAEELLSKSNGTNKMVGNNQYKYYGIQSVGQEGIRSESYLLEKDNKTYAWSIASPDINNHSQILNQILSTFQFTQ